MALAFIAGIAIARLEADVVWSGLGLNSNWTNPTNWVGGSAPLNDGTEQIVFGAAQRTAVLVDASQSIRRLRFDFSVSGPLTYSISGAATSLTLGSDGIEVIAPTASLAGVAALSATTGGVVKFDSTLGIVLAASQTWAVAPGSELHVSGPLSGSSRLTLSGGGYVALSGNNSYTGGTVLESGALAIESNTALGTGSLTVSGPAEIFSTFGARTIMNAFNLNTSLLDLLPYGGDFRVTGQVVLGTNVTLRNFGQPVYLLGNVSETGGSRSLTLSGAGAVVLSGVNTYTGGTAVQSGALFFSNAGAVPTTGALSSASQGYVGTGFTTGVQTGFISKFAPATTFGTIGFDTDPGAISAASFAEPIDLSALNAFARIGSTTRATLTSTAVITPAIGAGYRFGGGGGALRVESKLTGLNGLTVDSAATGTPLSLRISNTANDYSGLTSVTKSALIFETGALSSNSSSGSFVLGSGGYIGSTDPNVTLPTWLGKFSPTTTTGIIGFDSTDVLNPRVVSGNFDLSSFVVGTSIALGTSSAATISGFVTLPLLQNDYFLTGYRGGWLTANVVLTGVRGLRIGSATGDYPELDPTDLTRMSTVFLNGSNSHSSGTTLFSGRLVLGQASALGTGALTVDGRGANVSPRLETSIASNPTFTNAMIVQSGFDIGGVNPFTWSGNVSSGTSTGAITKHGAFNLVLSGNNAGFSGGFQINDGTITFATDTAAGSGGLNLGSSTSIASFTSAAPTLSFLQGQSSAARLTVANGTTLTINQANDSTFRGQIQGAGGIAKFGTGTLRLESAGSFSGGTTIGAGTVNVAASGALGTNTVTLNGPSAHLKLDSGVTLTNTIGLGANGARLSGRGTFGSNVVLGPNSVVAPGASVGTLTFSNGLTLAPGGSYDFEMQDAIGGPGIGWDFVQVSAPLTFTSTPTSPFTLNLISLSSSGAIGNATNFLPWNAYAWAIASATSFVGFNPGALAVNTTNFTSALNGGSFSFSTSGTNLMLNFTPVPEPSTWALLLAGLGLVAIRKLRRRF
jgi:autotransporter-associated beta strand protein